jgi:hypothetical protein
MSILSYCACGGSIDVDDDYICDCGDCDLPNCAGDTFWHRGCALAVLRTVGGGTCGLRTVDQQRLLEVLGIFEPESQK